MASLKGEKLHHSRHSLYLPHISQLEINVSGFGVSVTFCAQNRLTSFVASQLEKILTDNTPWSVFVCLSSALGMLYTVALSCRSVHIGDMVSGRLLRDVPSGHLTARRSRRKCSVYGAVSRLKESWVTGGSGGLIRFQNAEAFALVRYS